MTGRRVLIAGLGVALLAPLVLGPEVAAAAPVMDPAVGLAGGYLISQQLDDGSFDVGGVSGAETPDAILALAAAGQRGVSWDRGAARSAISGLRRFGTSPLDAIDRWVDAEPDPTSTTAAIHAARVVELVANPLGISAADFDPAANNAAPVDLLTRIDRHQRPDGSYDLADFSALPTVALALDGAGQTVPAGLLDQLVAGQNQDGSWDAAGSHGASGIDVVTTARTLLALEEAGRGLTDPAVSRGVAYLARTQQPSGEWRTGGRGAVDATAAAAIALSALHLDVSVVNWGAGFGPSPSPYQGYASPYRWLLTQLDPTTGGIRGPMGGRPVGTLATSQAVQALGRQWHLDDEHRRFAAELAMALGSSKTSPSTAAAPLASDQLGPNVATSSARQRAATAVLSSVLGRGGAAGDLYRQVFGRSLDASGQRYWVDQLATIPRPEVLARLTGSAEFYRVAGGTTPTFVDAAFRVVLGRAPDASGRAYWIAQLDRGVAVEQIARSLTVSAEYRRGQVDQAYRLLLDRPADASGVAYWTPRLLGTRIEVLLAQIAASREVFERS